ncbi:MAG: peptidase M64, partial [Saprospiraceae bacterium]|nr:peptidase M64 [Saprospiraceae bacterium]
MTRVFSYWLVLLACTPLVSQPISVDTIRWAGSEDDRINLVFLGDGYQESELDKYITDVHKVVDHFFTESPFKEYKPYFNILAIKVVSR